MAAEITDQAQVETSREAEKEHVEQVRAPESPTSAQPSPVEPHRDGGEQPTRSLTLTLPFVKARFEVPRPPSGPFHVGPVTLPSPGKAAFYTGLGALAVAGAVEWPVALAIGAGTYVSQHTRADEPALPHLEHAERPEHEVPVRAEQPETAEQREPAAAPA